jgi:hypothetical protein
MSKLIDVDKIEWQKGVFVNPNTEEPLPIIHKIATIEMLRDFQEEVKAIPVDNIKKARETIEDEVKFWSEPAKDKLLPSVKAVRAGKVNSYKHCLEVLDKLIESEEK